MAKKYAKYIENSEPNRSLVPAIIIYEVYKNLKRQYSEEKAIMAIAHIENYSSVIEIDMRYALKGADSSLQQKLPMADAIIWGIADSYDAKIITSDKHFKGKEKVIFIG